MRGNQSPSLALHRAADVLGDALSIPSARSAPTRPSIYAHKRVPRTRGGLLARIDSWFWRQQQRAVEAYLAQSQDVFEVERRMRDLERTIGSRFY
jgi:hypothetical protein